MCEIAQAWNLLSAGSANSVNKLPGERVGEGIGFSRTSGRGAGVSSNSGVVLQPQNKNIAATIQYRRMIGVLGCYLSAETITSHAVSSSLILFPNTWADCPGSVESLCKTAPLCKAVPCGFAHKCQKVRDFVVKRSNLWSGHLPILY